MSDPEIPDEAVRAAAEALAYQAHMTSRPTPPTWRDEAYEAISAALPALRRQLAESVATELETLADRREASRHGTESTGEAIANDSRDAAYREAAATVREFGEGT